MAELQITNEYFSTRCEICHQEDCFTPEVNYCSRCAGIINLNLIIQNTIKPSRQNSIQFELLNLNYYYERKSIYSNRAFKIIIFSVFSIIILAIAIPNLLATSCGRKGRSVIEAMRLFHSVEVTYYAGIGKGDFGTATELFYEDLIDGVLANAAGVPAMDSREDQRCFGDGSAKSGYYYVLKIKKATSEKPSKFSVIAISADQTNNRNYFVDETGVIRYSTVPNIPDSNSTPISQ